MTKKTDQPKQLAWQVPQAMLSAANLVEFAQELKNHPSLGPPSSITVTLNGSPLGVQLSGDPEQVGPELEALEDQSFVSANVKAQFQPRNNLTFTLSANLSLRNLTANVQNGQPDDAEVVLDLVRERFPREGGPTEHEAEQRERRLIELTRKAEAAAQAADEAQNLVEQMKAQKKQADQTSASVDEAQSDVNEALQKTTEAKEEATARLSEITNAKSQVQADRETVQEARESVGSIEASIRQFFEELEQKQGELKKVVKQAGDTVQTNNTETGQIISENKELQEEIREHLLKAVGASLFSAFEKRKGRIEVSKWVWAGFTALAVVAQVVMFFWLASQVADLPNDKPFYVQSGFFLRATASIPIIFFIGYAISQYARERDYEELYGFKSVLSFSLSPYLDLVKELGKEESEEKLQEFVVNTVGQIFENPLAERTHGGRSGKRESRSAKDILEQVIKIIESADRTAR